MEADTCSADSQSATGFTLAVLQDMYHYYKTLRKQPVLIVR